MKAQKAQAIMAGIDRYNGKTVDDLRKFMLEHHLKFAAVNDESADERNLYVDLYAWPSTDRRDAGARGRPLLAEGANTSNEQAVSGSPMVKYGAAAVVLGL